MVVANHFYQDYIAKKDHVHMNATKWNSLAELIMYLGRESVCRVEETDKGMMIGWIDTSPEALKRQEHLRRRALLDQGDEEVEQRLLREQIKRAQAAAGRDREGAGEEAKDRELKRADGEKITLSFGAAKAEPTKSPKPAATKKDESSSPEKDIGDKEAKDTPTQPAEQPPKPTGLGGFSMKMSSKPQVKNVFAQAKKSKTKSAIEQPKKMSEAERIMKEEMDRKRSRTPSGFGGPSAKKQRTGFGH
jgi:DNA/RNA-binding protein KIN17